MQEMNHRNRNIIGWSLTTILSLVLLWSASMKLTGQFDDTMTLYGYSKMEISLIGILEALSVLLFVLPKTRIIGTLMLTAYFGGAIATHVSTLPPHDNYAFPLGILIVVWVTSYMRNPKWWGF